MQVPNVSLPKPTEDTLTTILTEELRARGVHAQPYMSLKTPVGTRKPDIVCQDSLLYVVEAKFRERDFPKAIQKIYNDYVKHHKLIGPPALGGGFAVLYPERLARPISLDRLRDEVMASEFTCLAIFPPEDARPLQVAKGRPDAVADFIAEHVLMPPEKPEIPLNYVIGVLRAAAKEISAGLRGLGGRDIEGIFGGRQVFEYVLQYEEGRYPVGAMREAAAFILMDQILFYHILSRFHPEKLPEIDEDSLTRPSDLNEYFSRVLDINYRILFAYDIASLVPRRYLNGVKAAVAAVKAIGPEKAGPDLIGTIFHDLIPIEVRKHVAAFYTNPLRAEFLAHLAIEDPEAKVADLACGSGGLLVAAYRRKKYLLEEERRKRGYPEEQLFTAEDHRRFVEEDLLGVDVMPLAAHLAVINLASQAPKWPTNHVNVAVWDSTELSPGREIPSLARMEDVLGIPRLSQYLGVEEDETRPEKGVLSPEGPGGRPIRLETYDIIMMNPPFTRQERLPQEYKAVLDQRFLEYSDYFDGRMGYFGYFIFLADRFLKDGGRLALVLPASMLRVPSAEGIRRLLAERYVIEYIITAWERLAFSESAWIREILLVAQKASPEGRRGSRPCNIVTLRRLPENPSDAIRMAEEIRESRLAESGAEISTEPFYILSVSHADLENSLDNWFKYIAVYDPRIRHIWGEVIRRGSRKLVRFGDLLQSQEMDVVEGTRSRAPPIVASEMAIGRSESRLPRAGYRWVVEEDLPEEIVAKDRSTGECVSIPKQSLLPALITYSDFPTMEIREHEHDYVVVETFPGIERFLPNRRLEMIGSALDRWKRYIRRRLASLLIGFRYSPIAPGLRHVSFYSATPLVPYGTVWSVPGGGPKLHKITVLWMNSTLNLSQILVTKIQDIWIDVNKYALLDFLTLDPRTLSEEERDALLNLFDRTARVEFPSVWEQIEERFQYRVEIDRTILEVLGFSAREAQDLLEDLYDAMCNEFEALKRLS